MADSYTFGDVSQILKNVGLDVECGECMSVALTGSGQGHGHSCSNNIEVAVDATIEHDLACYQSGWDGAMARARPLQVEAKRMAWEEGYEAGRDDEEAYRDSLAYKDLESPEPTPNPYPAPEKADG